MILKITNRILWFTVVILALVSFFLFLFVIFNDVYYNTSLNISPELASKFGNFFGGFIGTMFTITSTLLILVTLITQNIENKKSQTGNNFFKMLDYHNENVRQLNISHIKPEKTEEIRGRRAFVIFKLQIKELFKVVNETNSKLELGLSKAEIADIVYVSLFYGIDDEWKEFSNELFVGYVDHENIVKQLIEHKKNHEWYIGRTNQTSLSSYYRNIYNAIKLIDDDKYLNIKEKEEYVKILRAQLSNPELYVLYFNTMSRFGEKWKDKKYIKKYKLMDNIPDKYLDGYGLKDLYKNTKEKH